MRKLLYIIILFSYLIVAAHAQLSQTDCANAESTISASAPWYCSQINQGVAQEWQQWEPIAMIAIMFSFMVAVVIFMGGIVAKNDRLRTYGIGEMYEAIATAIIVIMFLSIAAVLFGILPSITTGTIDPYDVSLGYIAKVINSTNALATTLFQTASHAAYQSTIGLSTCTSPAIGCFNALGIFDATMYLVYFLPSWSVLIFMYDAQFSLYIQYYMILFFLYSAIPVFLIPGVIFRSFIPTRHVGGMLMAVAIGFYFIMPVLFSIAYYFTSNSIAGPIGVSASNINKYSSQDNFVQQAVTPDSPIVQQLGEVKSTFSNFWLSILFFPALIIALTYAFVIQIAEFIGGMAKTSSRLRNLI